MTSKGNLRGGTARKLIFAALLGASGLCTGLAAFPQPASAQGADASGGGIETVNVTARRRSEDQQKVPVAVTALDQQQLDRAQIRTNTDLKAIAPSLNEVMSYTGQGAAYSIRGLGQGYAGATSVTTYFSEVPAITQGGTALFDLASVQVLRGPQGTLFGRATVGGAIVFTPNRPDLDAWRGSLDVTLGNYGRSNVTAVLNAPIVDGELGIRLSLHREHMDGYTSIIGSNTKLNETQANTARLGIDWEPDNRFSSYTVVEARTVDQTPSAELLAGYNPNFSLFNLPPSTSAPLGAIYGPAVFGAVCATAVSSGLSPDLNTCYDQHLGIAASFKGVLAAEAARLAAGGHDAIRSIPDSNTIPHTDTAQTYQFINNTQYHVGDLWFSDITLKNNFSYNLARSYFCDDIVGLPNNFIQSCSGQNSAIQIGNTIRNRDGQFAKNITEEFQILGDIADGTVQWIAGFYYSGGPARRTDDSAIPGCTNLNRVLAGILTPNLGWTCANPVTVGGYSWERGFYGNAVFDLSKYIVSGLHLTAGVRTTTNYSTSSTAPLVFSYPSGAQSLGPVTVSPALKTAGLGWNVALDYQLNDDLMVYGSVSRGYKPGGRNTIIGAVGAPGFTPTFGPELVTTTEIGFKDRFNFGHVEGLINADVYRNEYTNIQETLVNRVGASTFAYNENVAAAITQGFELETLLILWDDLQINGEYAYNDAHFTRYFGADPVSVARPGDPICVPSVSTTTLCLLDLGKEPFPSAMKNQGSLTLRYATPVDPAVGNVYVSVTGYAQSRVYWFTGAHRNIQYFGTTLGYDNIRNQVSQAPYTLFNARVDWDSIYGSNFSASLWVNNLADKVYAVGGFTQMAALGVNTKLYGPPRTYGVELKYEFGP